MVSKKKLLIYFILCNLFVLDVFAIDRIAAFPGAMGGGCYSLGGRGGRVIEVTNLQNKGPGSLRAACEARGPRTIIFKVSGIIDLQGKNIDIRSPFITIAGQTAPKGGILIRGHELRIKTHDVIIRYIKIRVGRNNSFGYQEGDALAISNNSYNIIIDHCSLSWSNDENVQIWTTSHSSHHITFSWNIIAEGLSYKHPSCGMIIGSDFMPEGIYDITIHHNLFMNLYNRLPLVKGKNAKIINNIFYNWKAFATAISGAAEVDIISNLYKTGPLNRSDKCKEIIIFPFNGNAETGIKGIPSLHISGNLGPSKNYISDNNKDMVKFGKICVFCEKNYIDRKKPFAEKNIEVDINSADSLECLILPDAGDSKRLDEKGCQYFDRDSVDNRLVKEYNKGTGIIPKSELSVGWFKKSYSKNGTKGYLDTDKDGLPDIYERRIGLDPNDQNDGRFDSDNDGYTNLEEFLNIDQ